MDKQRLACCYNEILLGNLQEKNPTNTYNNMDESQKLRLQLWNVIHLYHRITHDSILAIKISTDF